MTTPKTPTAPKIDAHPHLRPALAALLLIAISCAHLFAQSPAAAIRSRKAYLVVETRSHIEGDTKGIGRLAFEGLVQQCNNIRKKAYQLPEQKFPEDILESLDITRQEHAFDGSGYALSLDILHPAELSDMVRWSKDAKAAATLPGKPPDCTIHNSKEVRSGTLWRAGKRYALDYDKKRAVQESSRDIDLAPVPLSPPVVGSQLPQESFVGQTCSATGPVDALPGNVRGLSDQCVWNDFGEVAWMNLPLALRRGSRIGNPKRLIRDSVAQTADANPSFPKDKFEIPADFTVIERPSASHH